MRYSNCSLARFASILVPTLACGESSGDVVLHDDLELAGVVSYTALEIPRGVTVTATDDLVLVVDDLIVAGAIVAEPGVSITIEATGDASISGSVSAGDGASAAIHTEGEGAAGEDGGALVLWVDGRLDITGVLASGDGGHGEDRIESGTSDDLELEARGGRGGAGGDLAIHARRLSLLGSLYVGNGGHGGFARTIGPAAARRDFGGAGGDSGTLDLTIDEELSGLQHTEHVDDQGGVVWIVQRGIEGGRGGDGGDAGLGLETFEASAMPTSQLELEGGMQPRSETCWNPGGRDGAPATDIGGAGGAGFRSPSNGGSALAEGYPAAGTGTGGSATATGGRGGDLRNYLSIDLKFLDIPVGISVNAELAVAGHGGHATAIGGAAGPVGGSGGNAVATGGHGGDAHAWTTIVDIGAPQFGGWGGDATAIGGHGADGTSCCVQPPSAGQPGGTGGSATATAGNGGSGFDGGKGGNAIAHAGNGGDGGNGEPAAFGGARGAVQATHGMAGGGFTTAGDGVRAIGRGNDGNDGSSCPTPTRPPCTAPWDCEPSDRCALDPTNDEGFVCMPAEGELDYGALEVVFGSASATYESGPACLEASESPSETLMSSAAATMVEAALERCSNVGLIYAPADGEIYTAWCGFELDQPEMLTIDAVGYADCG